nr:uncharacterized protein LOC111512130 [Leptinotarsa decemlineata]
MTETLSRDRYEQEQLQSYSFCMLSHYISEHLVDIIKNIKLNDTDILASLDIKSLYPSIPINEALATIRTDHSFPQHVTDLAEHCLKNTYFIFDNQIYKQVEGAPMGSSLLPVIANLFMMHFEKEALNNSRLKPTLWKRYVDDIFIIWPHGKQELNRFVTYLNNIHPRIQFTTEREENRQLPFLDLLITRKPTGNLGYTVYRKCTHTNRYLQAASHHHPTQLQSVANTLIYRSFRLTEPTNRATELRETTKALRQNGYGPKIIQKAIDRQRRTKKTSTRSTEDSPHDRQSVTLRYVKGVTDKIGRILRRKNIRTTYKLHKTISSWLPRAKERISLENQGVYSITCEDYGQQYIGQTNRRISARTQEHKNSIRTKQTSSALFQHHLQTGHKINFESTKQIAQVQNPRIRQIREAIEIEKQGLINKRDDSLNIPRIWKTIIKNNHQRQPQIDNEPSQVGEPPEAINNPQVEKQVGEPPKAINNPQVEKQPVLNKGINNINDDAHPGRRDTSTTDENVEKVDMENGKITIREDTEDGTSVAIFREFWT